MEKVKEYKPIPFSILKEEYFLLDFIYDSYYGPYPLTLQIKPNHYQITLNFENIKLKSDFKSVNFIKKYDNKSFGCYLIDKNNKKNLELYKWKPETFMPIFDLINNKFVENILKGAKENEKYEGKEIKDEKKIFDSGKFFKLSKDDIFIFFEKEGNFVNITRKVIDEDYWSFKIIKGEILNEKTSFQIPINLFEFQKEI